MTNKITTMGYFIKRLRDSGYIVDKLYTKYSKTDPRSWSVVIDPDVASVFCTLYQNDTYLGETYFEIYDGGQFIPSKWRVKTQSIEVFIEHLVKFNINNKSPEYNKQA